MPAEAKARRKTRPPRTLHPERFPGEGGAYRAARDNYNTELALVASEKGQAPRHLDAIWPLWNLFDFAPEGRGTNWHPKLSYEA